MNWIVVVYTPGNQRVFGSNVEIRDVKDIPTHIQEQLDKDGLWAERITVGCVPCDQSCPYRI